MKKVKRKPHSGKHRRSQEVRHWLEVGVAGQESLLEELDPFLFVIDRDLSTLAGSLAHSIEKIPSDVRGGRSFCLFAPPEGTVGWQIGYLSKHFNVYHCADQISPFLEPALGQFDALPIQRNAVREIETDITLYLCTDPAWASFADFALAVKESVQLLSQDGQAAFVLVSREVDGTRQLCWGDGSVQNLDEVLAGRSLPLAAPIELAYLSLDSIDPLAPSRLQEFVRRNKVFFGKDGRLLLEARIREEEFSRFFKTTQQQAWGVSLLLWDANR